MIGGLCGFAELLRRHGGDVGSAELIDAARALTLIDLTNRKAVHLALTLTLTWSAVHPDRFDQLFDQWFSGSDLDLTGEARAHSDAVGLPSVGLDADTVDAARIHTDDATAVEARERDANGMHGDDGPPGRTPAPATAQPDDGPSVGATGTLAPMPPRDDGRSADGQDGPVVVELPNDPLSTELELARDALADAIERRHRPAATVARRGVTALTQPLSADERLRLARFVRRLDRQLDGAPSWQRARDREGMVDLRRTMRRTVTTGGLPIDLRHAGRRSNAALLVVLVDLSMSVRGTSRLILHLVHRMHSMVGSLRAFGFVDSCASIDGALRVADPAVAIEQALGLVDVDASSDPGAAFRQWWARWHHLVTPATHVMILGDGRCNGHDPAFDIVDRATRRSASTLWISPEPPGAWALGRGEMAEYARRVDSAVSVRSMDDLDDVTGPSWRSVRRGDM